MEPKNVTTVLDMRIAQGLKGIPYGQIKIVRGTLENGSPDYALFVNDDYLGSLDGAINDQQGILAGLGKIRVLVGLLSEDAWT